MSLSFRSKPVTSTLTSLSAEKKPDEKVSHIKNWKNVSVRINTYRAINPKIVQKALQELSLQYSSSDPKLSERFKKASCPNGPSSKRQEMINHLDELDTSELNNQLQESILKNRNNATTMLLYSGANPNLLVNLKNSKATILTVTILHNRRGWRELIAYGADVNYQYRAEEDNPLTSAIKTTHPSIVTELLKNKANPNKTSKGLTPLHLCLERAKTASVLHLSSYSQMIKALIERGANLDAQNKSKETAIEVANRLTSTNSDITFYFNKMQSELNNAQSEKIIRELEEGRFSRIESKEGKYS